MTDPADDRPAFDAAAFHARCYHHPGDRVRLIEAVTALLPRRAAAGVVPARRV